MEVNPLPIPEVLNILAGYFKAKPADHIEASNNALVDDHRNRLLGKLLYKADFRSQIKSDPFFGILVNKICTIEHFGNQLREADFIILVVN